MKHAYRWTAPLALSLLTACGGGSHSSSTAPKTVTIGGSISGLTASGLVLLDNGGDALPVAENATSFLFPTAVPVGMPYNVSVQTQPTGETCTITGAGGTANATVTSVAVTCTANTYTIGGSISGLTASGLVLLDNGGDALPVTENATSFKFPTALAGGAAYDVTVEAGHQPTGETCTVTDGSNMVVSSNVTSVVVTCTLTTPPVTYTIGGTIEGLSASATGLVLLDNGADALTITPAVTAFPFTFATELAGGAAYAVTVQTQPTGETCTVTDGSDTVGSSNVTGVIVSCSQYAAALGTNVVPMTVGNGPAASTNQIFNVPYVTVTVCEPSPPNACATINNVEVDTGSVGLRLLASALANPDSGSPVSLTAIADPANSLDTISECWPFGGGADAWGAVATANVEIGTETATEEIQVINDDTPATTGCGGIQYGTVSDFDANGVLGVGVLRQDCGAGCVNNSGEEYYYTCTSSASSSCTQVGLVTADQVPNPVAGFTASGDDNGVILQLPAIPDTGLPSANGYLVFGINTETDNSLPGTATVLTADSTYGTFTTIYNGTPMTAGDDSGGILDSGSNGLYFPDPNSTITTCSSAPDFFCPTPSVDLTAQNENANGSGTASTVNFEIGDLETIAGGGSFAIDNAGGPLPLPPQSGSFFDWGLPFFYGRTVFLGIEGSTGTPAPYYAY